MVGIVSFLYVVKKDVMDGLFDSALEVMRRIEKGRMVFRLFHLPALVWTIHFRIWKMPDSVTDARYCDRRLFSYRLI